jgi:hypothetical protein
MQMKLSEPHSLTGSNSAGLISSSAARRTLPRLCGRAPRLLPALPSQLSLPPPPPLWCGCRSSEPPRGARAGPGSSNSPSGGYKPAIRARQGALICRPIAVGWGLPWGGEAGGRCWQTGAAASSSGAAVLQIQQQQYQQAAAAAEPVSCPRMVSVGVLLLHHAIDAVQNVAVHCIYHLGSFGCSDLGCRIWEPGVWGHALRRRDGREEGAHCRWRFGSVPLLLKTGRSRVSLEEHPQLALQHQPSIYR